MASRTRMGADARRRQLVGAALELFAERGFGNVTPGAVADAVGVTPNLLYHYFPGGIREVYVEAVRLACQVTAAGLDTDDSRPLRERQPENFARYLDAMLDPSPHYRIFRQASADPDPAVQRLIEDARDRLAGNIALNNLGTREPPRAVHVALRGYLEFVETVCAQARARPGLDRPELERLLARSLAAILDAAGARQAGG